MNFSDETLIAYADGELDAQARAAVEAAMASDPEVARRLAKHLVLASQVRAAFDPVLREPVPERLKQAVAGGAGAANAEASTVIDIAKARGPKAALPERERERARRWTWREWSAIAATLVLGVWAGRIAREEPPLPQGQGQMAMESGALVARGALERALSTQLASTQPIDAPVRIGISFRSKSGEHCRTFTVSGDTAGLGCRVGPDWRLQVVTHSPAVPLDGSYRMAAGDLPPAVVREVEARIAGNAFDAREEEAAQLTGWRK